MRRILIATEGSACSQEAIRHFVEVLGAGPVEVFALCVIPQVTGVHTMAEAEAELENSLTSADQALDAARLETAAGGLQIRTMRRVGEPAETILRVAHEIDATLIVLGTHGPEALVRLAGGSVAEAVLRDAPCGVMIFPWHAKALAPAVL